MAAKRKHLDVAENGFRKNLKVETRNSEIVFSQYEVARKICSFLSVSDLLRTAQVNRILRDICRLELNSRRSKFSTFSWKNTSIEKHRWYDLAGNSTIKFHLENGLIEAAKLWSLKQDLATPSFNLFFGTGVTYVNYLWNKSLHFIVHEDLTSVKRFHDEIFGENSKTLFFTTLKILSPVHSEKTIYSQETSQQSVDISPLRDKLDVSVLHIPAQPPGVEIRTFHMTSQTLIPNIRGPEDKKRVGSLRYLHWAAFQSITGVDPRTESIRAVVVFNVCEMIHILRQVSQDFGPFPIIGCDSESLSWLVNNNPIGDFSQQDKENQSPLIDYNTCTSGFVILGGDDVRTASVVLDVDHITEEAIKKKFEPLAKLTSSSPKRSWGLMLSSCMRGYDGEDIGAEHIDSRNQIQNLECKIFSQIVANNFVGAQVEDIIGTNQIMLKPNEVGANCFYDDNGLQRDGLGLYTPDMIADDSSSVFLVVHNKT